MCYVRMTDAQAAPYGRLRTVDEWLDMARQMRDSVDGYYIMTPFRRVELVKGIISDLKCL